MLKKDLRGLLTVALTPTFQTPCSKQDEHFGHESKKYFQPQNHVEIGICAALNNKFWNVLSCTGY
jgi:hypothetical protein